MRRRDCWRLRRLVPRKSSPTGGVYAGGSVRAKCRVAGGSVLYCAVTEAGAGIPAKVCVRVLRAMLLDVTRPLGRGHRPHRHRYGPGWAHAYRHRPGDISGATPVRTALARVLLSPSLAKAEAAPSPATCLTCRCHLRRLDLSHSRDRRDPVWNLREAGVLHREGARRYTCPRATGGHATSQIGRHRGH